MSLTILKRSSACYRPYQFKNYYVDSIVFFNETGIIYKTITGWLESSSLQNEIKSIGGKDVEYIEIEEPKLKRKVDFTVKHNFYTTRREYNETKVVIYILCNSKDSIVSVKEVKEEIVSNVSLDKDIHTYKMRELIVSGVNGDVIHVTDREHLKTELTELGKRATELVEKHKNDDYTIREIDVYTWIRILKQYDLVEKKN